MIIVYEDDIDDIVLAMLICTRYARQEDGSPNKTSRVGEHFVRQGILDIMAKTAGQEIEVRPGVERPHKRVRHAWPIWRTPA